MPDIAREYPAIGLAIKATVSSEGISLQSQSDW